MKFDFETLVQRNNSSLIESLMTPEILAAGNVSFTGAEPLYATAPAICQAVSRMARNGRFGYTLMDDVYRRSVFDWMGHVRQFEIKTEWIVPTLGTIHSLAVAIRQLTAEHESILVTPPVYNRYLQAATRLNRKTVKCPLKQTGDRYQMDFAAIERAMSRDDVKLFVLCNPHNPIGQIWTDGELRELAILAKRHGVVVFSDEIFAENSLGDRLCPCYLTIPEAADNCIVATSLGKAFGTTGFNHANMLIPDKKLREDFIDRRDREHYGSMDPVAYESLLGAYSKEGQTWLMASNNVIANNINVVKDYFAQHLPDVPVYGGEGGYIIWMDWRNRFSSESALMEFLHCKAFLHLDAGSHYGSPEGYARMSLACPTSCVTAALATLGRALLSCEKGW